MSEQKTDYKRFDTYVNLMPVMATIGVIIGAFIFRKMVLTGWHMPQSVKDGDGGPLIFIIVGFFTEVLPFFVALFPGGVPGYLVGYLVGVILALLFMLIATIAELIQNACYEHEERKQQKIVSRARNRLLELCNSKEKAIQLIQELIRDKDCYNTYFQCAKLFNYVGNTDIFEKYTNMKLEDDKEVFENVKKIAVDYKMEITIDTWTMHSLFNWCSSEVSKVRQIRGQVYDAQLLDLKRMMDEV